MAALRYTISLVMLLLVFGGCTADREAVMGPEGPASSAEAEPQADEPSDSDGVAGEGPAQGSGAGTARDRPDADTQELDWMPDPASAGAAGAGEDGSADLRPPRTQVSFDSARPLEVGGQTWLQDILESGQVDYYSFRAEEGVFYEVLTDRHRFSPDLILSLHDADHNPIAHNDAGSRWPGDAVDARLVVRVPEAGEYFVRVEDPWTPPQFFEGPLPLLYYHVSVRALTDEVPGVALVDGSEPVEVTPEVDEASGFAYVTLLGEFHTEPDVFELAGGAEQVLVGEALASGTEGNGSTTSGGGLRVVEAQSHLLAEIDLAAGQTIVSPPVGEDGVRVELVGGSELGDNPFYAVNLVLAPDSPAEVDDAANGELEGAETVDLGEGLRRRALVRLTLPPGDVDHVGFEASEGERIGVVCEGESAGSGVRGLSVEVLDGAENLLGDGLETNTLQLQIPALDVTETGRHYLRLSSETPEDADAAEPWLRCSITVGI